MGAAALPVGLTSFARRVGALLSATVLLAGLVAALQLSTVAPATADDCPGGWGGEAGSGGVDVCGSEGGEQGNPGGGGGGGGGAISVPVPWTQRVYVPNCADNSVRATGPGVRDYETINDVLCTAFDAQCPVDGEYSYRVFERAMGADNRATEDNFSSAGITCRGSDEPNESEPPTITTEDIIERALALAPTPTFVIEPADRSYVNIPTNFAAEAQATTVTVDILGFQIPVEFTPGTVTWSFGDGRSGSGIGVEGAAVGQSGAVEHAYARSGAFDVSVSVAYTVRITTPAGPIDMPAPIDRTSAPQTLEVGEIQSVVTEVD